MIIYRHLVLVVFLLGITNLACAQQSPADASITPVQEVLTNAQDDTYVTVQGRLVEYLGDEDYVLEDETGRIAVDIDDDLLEPRDFVEGMMVEIFGEVDRDRNHIEVEAERIRLL